ncbi:hypothetical protein EHS13_24150 [Paenibacillus psychroresistens]|uniref:Dienelactone hydrolase domain-containing protein n=1 Tax=Paenibacillus psychroresistens TaxID=1778678 RepID=A0A6B8RR53_9BACL|nr:dienelactone hydrolase family protein [Paenibacillus psychroresistens]QGQ97758.1 hypothetical protein EHS13_24150 [Paenibacillus psychroresistens]
MKKFIEPFQNSKWIREDQYLQLDTYLNKKLLQAEEKRENYFQPDFSSAQNYAASLGAYREDLNDLIGYPPSADDRQPSSREIYVGEDELCRIYRLFIHAADGLECYGIYMVPKKTNEKAPLMVCLHGYGGCPEMVCNFEGTFNYTDAGRRFVEEGYIVFAPFLIFRSHVDNDETIIPANMRLIMDERAKWVGSSLVAVELFKLRRALDVLESRTEVDSTNMGVAGLSYGGFYALFLAALDERIQLCISSGYLNDRLVINEKLNDHLFDWTWKGAINRFSDAEIVGLICPRKCIIEFGIHDDLFPVEGARKVISKARTYFDRLGLSKQLQYIEFDGGHEFHLEEAIQSLREETR